MESLESKYYEASRFWEEGVFEDVGNIERISATMDMIPAEVESLLDAGCGNGLFLNALLEKRPAIKCHGFDRSEEALKYVKVEKSTGDIGSITFPDGSFNCVTSLEVIEHLPVTIFDQALSELSRVSNKYLLISVPYNEDLREAFTQCPSCLSNFNSNMHMRSFSTDKFVSLFNQYGFTSRKFVLAGKSTRYKYHSQYRKVFYPSQFRQWLSPLCPICGYEERIGDEISNNEAENLTSQKESAMTLGSMIRLIPKIFWPKEEKYYWIIGLFEKTR
jgi:SAM-dependent methyltransferase